MRFSELCEKLAVRMLCRRGTIVECMNPDMGGGRAPVYGQQYVVQGISPVYSDMIRIDDLGGYFATNFRKVIK